MPNWVNNNVAVKGEITKVKNFLNVAFEHIGKEMPNDLLLAVETINDYIDSVRHKDTNKYISLSTWKPIPDDFEVDKDTTNYPDKYPELVKYQREKYGCVGWYDFQVMWFGCKWDSRVEHISIENYDSDIVALFIGIETPWSEPLPWLITLQHDFKDLVFFNCSTEESGLFYHFYDMLYQEETEFELDSYISDYEGEAEDEYDIQDECLETLFDDLNTSYEEYVREFDIAELENF